MNVFEQFNQSNGAICPVCRNMNTLSLYENMLKAISDAQTSITNRDTELWECIKELNDNVVKLPETLPSNCTIFISDWLYEQLVNKSGITLLPNFIMKSSIIDQNQIIIIKLPTF